MALRLSSNPDRTHATLIFSQPKGNLLTEEVIGELRGALVDLRASPHLKLLTIEGAGLDFSLGANIHEHVPGVVERVVRATHALILELLELPMPTAAVVRGRCLGVGFELALACDFIVSADTAVFGLPEVAIGLFPPAACVLLPLRVGAARATDAILSGEVRPAAVWESLGLVALMERADNLGPALDAWFKVTLASKSAVALRHAVRAARLNVREAVRRDLPVIEQIYLRDLMPTDDAIEGVRAFLEKRRPRWKDQ